MVIQIFTISTVTWNCTGSISPGIFSFFNCVLKVKNFISDGIGYTVYSWWNLIFPWTFSQTIHGFISCKMELRWINSSPLLSQGIGMIYFGGSFVCLSHFLYIFAKKRLLWNQAIFSNFFGGNLYSVNFETGILIISVFFS